MESQGFQRWPKSRSKGAKAQGRAYEKKVFKHIKKVFPNAESGRWIVFQDVNGKGYAQPDTFVELTDKILCFEAKLKQCSSGFSQINLLYKPLLEHIFKNPCIGIQVCKILRWEIVHRLEDVAQAQYLPNTGQVATLHYLGE